MEQLMIHWMNNQIFVRSFLLKQIINIIFPCSLSVEIM